MKLSKAIFSSEKLLRFLLNVGWSLSINLLLALAVSFWYLKSKNLFIGSLGLILVIWVIGLLIIRIVSPLRHFRFPEEDLSIESLRATEKIYRTIIDRSPDSVSATDLLGRFIFVSPQTAIMHGYDDPEEMIGKSAFDLFPTGEVARAVRYMQMTREGGTINNVEFTLTRKDGSQFPAELSASLITNEAGLPVAFMSIVRDITERKQVSVQLARANEQLQEQIREIETLQEYLREQAIRDPLTDLFNRRYMKEATVQEHARATRENYPYSLIMIDMDKLKDINDTYGHPAGDLALQTLAEQIKKNTRIEDTACRYGGDEFLIVLHDTPIEVANLRVESWRINLLENPILLHGQPVTVTFTAGIATFPMHGHTLDEILHHADQALYRAKATGGNRVLMFG